MPASALKILEAGQRGEIPDTPKQGNMVFDSVSNVLIGNNYGALLAAKEKAESLGYSTLVLSSRISGEAREVAKVFAGIGKDIAALGIPLKPPAALFPVENNCNS